MELKNTFQALDKNGDGRITFAELQSGLGHRENAETLMNLLKAADTDNSGSIDYTEFLAATMDAQVYLRDDYIRTAFTMFDRDGNGKIDKNEVLNMLQGEDLQNLVPKEELTRYIKEVDANGDGQIDFDEF